MYYALLRIPNYAFMYLLSHSCILCPFLLCYSNYHDYYFFYYKCHSTATTILLPTITITTIDLGNSMLTLPLFYSPPSHLLPQINYCAIKQKQLVRVVRVRLLL
jgi:hypothetical protein